MDAAAKEIEREYPIYRQLQKHLDKLPVGFPKTRSGVELKILHFLFNEEQALICTFLTKDFEPVAEIEKRMEQSIYEIDGLEEKLKDMVNEGLIISKKEDGVRLYANISLVIGMFEFNLNRLTLGFLKDVEYYFKKGYAIEMINSQVPQLRTVPINQSINAEKRVADYDEVNWLIENAPGPITVADCICKTSHDMDGDPCKVTDKREWCINMGLMGQNYLDQNIGREISRDEAMQIIEEAQKVGLILQVMNTEIPDVICACCGCCCGVLNILQELPRPVDFIASNFIVELDEATCAGCGTCVDRCNMYAISLKNGKASIKKEKCIGCGVCVPTCPENALTLTKKDNFVKPPKDRTTLYDLILEKKKNRFERIKMLLKVLLRIKA